jgi:hypothetical protein
LLLNAVLNERPRLYSASFFFLAVLSTCIACAACDDPKVEVQYGDPVGIQIDARGGVPTLSVAVAVTKGRDVSATVSSVAGAMFGAASGCPAAVATLSGGSIIRLTMTAQGGTLHAPPKLPEDKGASCMIHALDGKPVTTDKPDALDVIVELRAGGADGGKR